jgi:site-specific recombinase XerD
MSRAAPQALFALVESFFTEYLPRQRGASVHTIRAYRDALKLLFAFVAEQRGCSVASLELQDLDAKAISRFLDHIEAARSNAVATRNCRRAAKERTQASFEQFFTLIGKELAEKIEFVCSDMWKPYLKVIEKHCINALNILDRFHVVAKMNLTIDEVRSAEARRMA